MTNQDLTGDGEQVPTLQQLIRARMDEQGWTYGDLERLSGGRLTKSRWQQLATGVRMRSWPEPDTVRLIAELLGLDATTVILASARSLDLQVSGRAPLLAQLLPAGTDLLSERMRSAILAMIRAAVEDVATRDTNSDEPARTGEGGVYVWPREDAQSSRGNAAKRVGDTE